MSLNKIIKPASNLLLYIPLYNKHDIVRTAYIDGVLNYCVNDFGRNCRQCCVDDSSYIWDYKYGRYLQYAPSLKKIYQLK